MDMYKLFLTLLLKTFLLQDFRSDFEMLNKKQDLSSKYFCSNCSFRQRECCSNKNLAKRLTSFRSSSENDH